MHSVVYDELLADKSLDQETRALVLDCIRLDEKEVAKKKADAKRRRLKALCDDTILEPDLSLKSGIISHYLPGSDVRSPRDRKKLQDTRDILFLATLIELSHESGWVLQCAALSGQGDWIYHPGESTPAGYAIKQKFSTRGLRRIFRESFFGYRRALGSPNTATMTFSLGGVVLRPAGSRGDKAFWDLAARLDNPFFRGGRPSPRETSHDPSPEL